MPNTKHAARYDAETTRESDVAAMRHVDEIGLLPELVATVRAMTRGAGDEQSLAFLTGARMLAGDKSKNVARAARVGVKQARAMTAVYAAREYAASETLQAFWDEPVQESDDYAAEKVTDRARGAGLSPMTAPSADAWLNVTRRDVATDAFHVFCESHDVATRNGRTVAVICRTTSPHAAIWQDSIRAYMRHDCEACTGRGRRPSLNGILAHTRGIPSGHSDAWALRRLVNRAAAVAAPELGRLWAEYVNASCPRHKVWTPRGLLAALSQARRAADQSHGRHVDEIAARAPLTRRGYSTARVVESVQVSMPSRPAAPIWETRPNDWTGATRRAWSMLAHDVSAEIAWESVWHDVDGASRDAWRAALRATLPVDRDAELGAPVGAHGNGREGMPTSLAPRLTSPAVRAELPATGRAMIGRTAPVAARTVQVTRAREVVETHALALPALADDTGAVDVDTVTVRTRNGETYSRPMRDDESDACERVRVNEARYDGESYGETSGRTNVPDARGNVASRKPAVPRKRGTRGATGSVVSAGMVPRDAERMPK